MTSVLIVGYGSIGKKHLENFLQFKDIQLTVYTKRNDLQLLRENGIKISVPPFINSNDRILLDSRSLEYIKKIK